LQTYLSDKMHLKEVIPEKLEFAGSNFSGENVGFL
jgi:hypothetical protein